ncbi:cyclic lactone autoinducer peptide [Paenibacillus spongiae]
MKTKFARVLATALGGLAVVFVSTACIWVGHRPETPAELLQK